MDGSSCSATVLLYRENTMSKNVIVTGANGFVGSAVVKELLCNHYNVYAVVHNGCRTRLSNDSGLMCISGDMRNTEEWIKELPQQEYACIYHFAWAASAGPSRADVGLQLQNVLWTSHLLRAAEKIGCKRIVAAGSIMEHETLESIYGEDKILGAGNIYGGGKVAAHIMNMVEAARLGISLIWGSITNAYGPGEISPRLINTSIQKCLRGISPQFTSGTQNYDFVYIDDVARAFRLIGERGKAYEEYLIGSSQAKPLKQFLLEMQQAIAPDVPFLFGSVPFRGMNLPLTAFDCSKTKQDTGFRATVGFTEGCKRTAAWWRNRLNQQLKCGRRRKTNEPEI